MFIRLRDSALCLSLLLGCLTVEARAQQTSPAQPANGLFSLLKLPPLGRVTKPKPARGQPATAAAVERANEAEQTLDSSRKRKAAAPKIDESVFESPFSATTSNRRSAIVKRETAQTGNEEPVQPLEPHSAHLPPVTPHWTPKFVEQAVYAMPDDELARPVAVNMAGEVLATRVTPAKAVARMDATLSVVPALAKAQARSAGESNSPAHGQ
jgi:hypothetical protein